MGFFITLIIWAITFVLSELLKPKPKIENARPAGLGEFNFPTATQGRVVPLIWGTVKMTGPNVVWYGDLEPVALTRKVKTGMFSSKQQIYGYNYYMGIQFAFCRGELTSLLKIWVNEDILWEVGQVGAGTFNIDELEFLGGEDLGQGGIAGDFDLVIGSETQAANTYLSAHQQEGGDTPAYRGTAFLVGQQPYLGNSTNIGPWAFELRRIADPLSLGAAATINGNDFNPANVIYEILTDTDWGMGNPSSDLNISNFQAAGNTLATEGNGFSFILDNPIELTDLLAEVERQCDAIVYLNRESGLWEITLARGGYVLLDLPHADEETVIEVKDYSRGTWDETLNEVRVEFISRSNEYVKNYAVAQDPANQRIQAENVYTSMTFGGVKDADLANNLVWRELRTQSRPLGKATLIVDRTFWNINPGDVLRWSNEKLEIVNMPMRVNRVDLGELADGKISLSVVEDIYTFEEASYASPEDTGWVPPAQSVSDIATIDRVMFEAPKAFIDRDPLYPGLANRVWAGARSQGNGEIFLDLEVVGSIVGTVVGYLLAGELNAALDPVDNGGNITLDADPDSVGTMLGQLADATDEDIGVSLSNLVLVNDELIAFSTFTDTSPTVRLDDCFRGMCDTAAAHHAAGDRVYFLFVAGGLTDFAFTGASVSVKPIPISHSTRLASGSATATVVPLASRNLKPYPPALVELNSTVFPTGDVSLDVAVSASDDGDGIQTDWVRRDYRNAHEVEAYDEANLPVDFPTINSTQYQLQVRDDPDGANTLLFTVVYQTAALILLSRTEILRYTAGVIPSRMRLVFLTRHTISTVVHQGQELTFDFDSVSAELDTWVNMGALDENDVGVAWTTSAPDTGTYAFDIGADVITGSNDVEARINGGGWASVIAAGLTSGTLAGVTAGDTIEVRHTESGADTNQTLLTVTPPTDPDGAYAVLII